MLSNIMENMQPKKPLSLVQKVFSWFKYELNHENSLLVKIALIVEIMIFIVPLLFFYFFVRL
jgi:hypothetical protein